MSNVTLQSTSNTITVVASTNGSNVLPTVGHIDAYSYDNASFGYSTVVSAALNEDMTIYGLVPANWYHLSFYGRISSCSGVVSYSSTRILYACTAPTKPIVLLKAISPSEIEVTIINRYYDSAVVEINENEGKNSTITFNSRFTTTVFSALTPETTYRITVTLIIGGTGGRYCIQGPVSTSSVFIETTPMGLTPVDLSFSFVTSSVCRLIWRASPAFINVTQEDSYNVLLNGQLFSKTSADKEFVSVIVDNLNLCDSYTVTIVPTRGDYIADGLSINIRNWNDSALIADTYTQFPDALGECDVCPSVNFSETCSFPFTSGGKAYSKCAQSPDGSENLFCLNGKGWEVDCNPRATYCLSPVPSFSEDMTFETISPGVINITWSTNTDYYTSFILYLNEDNFLNTTDKFHLLDNLTAGNFYEFEVIIESYGRIGDNQFVLFQATDKSSNAFAHSPTPTAVKLSWDSFLTDDKRRFRRSSDAIDAINIEVTFEISDLLTSLFTQELAQMFINTTIGLGTSAELQNLTSGFRYKVVISGITSQGERVENTSLVTEAVTVPGNITDEENQIALVASSSDGLELQFQLTNRSFSELINVIITLVTTSLSTEQ
ncbi:uncharacterized protein LOC142357808, partial [Convolutriloba macropyga]|uniref:uncharacterized protein LOC142357808 n=1 Tax=Convolutriloba macropyga TaxID=536237 RepID=UPI003F5203EC